MSANHAISRWCCPNGVACRIGRCPPKRKSPDHGDQHYRLTILTSRMYGSYLLYDEDSLASVPEWSAIVSFWTAASFRARVFNCHSSIEVVALNHSWRCFVIALTTLLACAFPTSAAPGDGVP